MSTTLRIAALATALVAMGGQVARAGDRPIPGKKLVVRARGAHEVLRFAARTRVTLPAPGGADDPRVSGATLQIANPTTGEAHTFELPAAHWKLVASGAYRYRDRRLAEGDGIAVGLIGRRGLGISSSRAGITLDEPSQGALTIVLGCGPSRYCARFDGGSVKVDRPGRFKARRAKAPAACPPAPSTSTTTTLAASTTSTAAVSTSSTTTSTTTAAPPTSSTTTTATTTTTTTPTTGTTSSSTTSSITTTTTTTTTPSTSTTTSTTATTPSTTSSTATTSSTSTIPSITTSTSTTTTTATLPTTTLLPPLGHMTFTTSQGTTSCGGIGLSPPPSAPFSGEVDGLLGVKRSDLGLGCLYVGGGGTGGAFPPARIPDGGVSVLDVTGVNGFALALGASAGSGPADCTRGAGPARHCLNGATGTDGMGACSADADCPGNSIGACDLDANCFFGPPTPLPSTALPVISSCVLNAISTGASGSANLLTRATAVSIGLSARVYLTGDFASPCPRCVAGACTAGERAGLPCSGGVGSMGTTIECPPLEAQFQGRLAVALAPVATGTSTAVDLGGNFCPGQAHAGAFGGPATTIKETGSPLLGGGSVFATTLAATFCVPATGNVVIDGLTDLPGPGALSVPGTASVQIF